VTYHFYQCSGKPWLIKNCKPYIVHAIKFEFPSAAPSAIRKQGQACNANTLLDTVVFLSEYVN
jgi:hypothetical protein